MTQRPYRGKRLDNGEWIEGCYAYNKFPLSDKIDHIIIVDGRKAIPVDPETVGQYSGLDDREGNKIFEGDIIDVSGRPMAIIWDDMCAQYAVQSPSGIGYLDMNLDLHEYAVIGNRWDHPHLLKP